ncbi:DUF1801 domain-containing protein [Desnuesiella massiliensis]|uniref:DUF1801 domain-containing protein n=1 Tax=Desnuesiella massiliensis TaxID=1650662 RepID=UPI0006E14243|nr:DUF1801 domain-containing protein [Desnuesiella massiliensis]
MSSKSKYIDVNDFMKNLEHPLKELIEEIREIILSTNKEITEHIKWNAPSFCYRNDDRMTFKLNKNDRVQLVFHTGAKGKDTKDKGHVIDDQTGLLEWVADKRALLTFYSIDEIKIKRASMIKIINQWLEATLS